MTNTLMRTAAITKADDVDEATTYAKVTWRLLPFLFICYVAAYLDRVNVGFAKLQMLSDLKFSETIYGLGAGIFFIGYFIFEIPSNLMLHRFGARKWIARIMISWGAISGLMMLVQTPTTFYILRFFLGVAEAGFFPGIILYLTYWYPAARRSKVTSLFMTGIPMAGVIGGPLSGWILTTFDGRHGLAGWKWLFVLEAIPSILVGVMVLFTSMTRSAIQLGSVRRRKRCYNAILTMTVPILRTTRYWAPSEMGKCGFLLQPTLVSLWVFMVSAFGCHHWSRRRG